MILTNHATGNDSHTKLLIQSNNANGSTIFTDVSAVGNTVTGYGGIAHSTAQYKNGKSSVYFDGTDDYLSVANFTLSDLFSIDFWMYPTETPPANSYNGNIINQGEAADAGYMWGVGINENLSLRAIFRNALDVEVLFATANGFISLNTWYHVQVSRNGNNFSLYSDGVLKASGTSSVIFTNAYTLEIGRREILTEARIFYFKGYLDQIRISTGIARKPIIQNRMF